MCQWKYLASQILVSHDVRFQVETPPIQLGFEGEKSKFHTCTKGGRCVIIFFARMFFSCKTLMFRGRLLFFCSQQPSLETVLGSVVFHSWRVLFTSLPSILGLLEIDLPSTGFIFIISESITCRKFPFEYIYVVLEIIRVRVRDNWWLNLKLIVIARQLKLYLYVRICQINHQFSRTKPRCITE